MANIQRNRKIGGTNTFESEFQLGFDDIRAMEIDADFDTIYNAWNAGIDAGSLVDGSVTASKIAADSITSNHIVNGSITELDLVDVLQNRLPPQWSPGEHDRILAIDPTGQYLLWVASPPSVPGGPAGGDLSGTYPDPTIRAGSMKDSYFVDNSISGMRIQPTSINYLKLADGTIPNAKLAPNAAVAGQASGNLVNNLSFSGTIEMLIVTFANIVTRGGNVHLWGSWGFYTTGPATGTSLVTMRVKRDGNLVHAVTHTLNTNLQLLIPVPECIDVGPAAGSHVYTITCFATGNPLMLSRPTTAENGKLWLEEF